MHEQAHRALSTDTQGLWTAVLTSLTNDAMLRSRIATELGGNEGTSLARGHGGSSFKRPMGDAPTANVSLGSLKRANGKYFETSYNLATQLRLVSCGALAPTVQKLPVLVEPRGAAEPGCTDRVEVVWPE
jgi:hypothetical protein